MPLAEFEPETPATKRPQTYDLDRAATGIGIHCIHYLYRVIYTNSLSFKRILSKGYALSRIQNNSCRLQFIYQRRHKENDDLY
jgi:hypothetical protein